MTEFDVEEEEWTTSLADFCIDESDNDSEDESTKELDESVPFDIDELNTFLKVMDCLSNDEALLRSPEMRQARVRGQVFLRALESYRYGGRGQKEYMLDKELQKEKNQRLARQRKLDELYLNKTRLRASRQEKLQGLLNTASTLPLIADGAADDDDTAQCITAENEGDAMEQHETEKMRSCYICKCRYNKLHQFYFLLCPKCAAFNYEKRHQTADMTGKVALVTGARVKIGYQCVLKLLRAGATVIATTRFPQDAAERYRNVSDYQEFKDRLHIYGVDFRDLVHLENFLDFINTRYSRLDAIINNACQTIRRPPAYYRHLIEKETNGHQMLLGASDPSSNKILESQEEFTQYVLATNSNGANSKSSLPSALKSQITTVAADMELDDANFPKGMLDINNQQIDLRTENSWLLRLGQVSTPEVAEVFAINTLAPFVINNKLTALLDATPGTEKFIVNVSAMEGKFYRYKTPQHPHTNMAKAALNMMTRTCAEDLSKRGIYMNSVDTGWINDENPLEKAHQISEKSGFETPIDEIDAAARILDPVFATEKKFGLFYKDYRSTEW